MNETTNDAATVAAPAAAEPEMPAFKPLAGFAARKSPASATLTLRDLLVLTYAMPVDRILPHVPENLPLDMLPSLDGERMAFVQVLCAFHENARWALLPEKMGGGQSFHQITYRVLTRREGRRGAFALQTYVSTDEGRAAQRAISRDAGFARFSLYIAGDPARATYDGYTLRAQGDVGKTQIAARAATEPIPTPFPFGSPSELSAFLVDRPDNYFRASAPKTGIGLLPQSYGELPAPTALELTESPRLTLWNTLKLFGDMGSNGAEAADTLLLAPYAALLFPAVTVTSYPPRYAKLGTVPPAAAMPGKEAADEGIGGRDRR